MHSITLISTLHKEVGKCNAEELCTIISNYNPGVIFLEALQETYSRYDNLHFTKFGKFHKKLEIAAMQKYSLHKSFKYIPVLDYGLSDAFERKHSIVSGFEELQNKIDHFNSLASLHGFKFLNSAGCTDLQEEMRLLENRLLNDADLKDKVDADIDSYENSMIRNIYSFCRDFHFDAAIFMCGVAHRKSIIQKIEIMKTKKQLNLNWSFYE